MSKLLLLFVSVVVCGTGSLAQSRDTTILLPNRLVISSIKRAQPIVELDTSGLVSIVCLVKSDTLIRQQQRQLSGKMIGYTDSSIVLLVEQESALTYYRNGTVENFYYWRDEDSLKNHVDTIRFDEIYTISYNRGTFRQVRGILQSTAYLYVVGNIVVLVTAFIAPKPYGSLVGGQNLMNTTGIALGAGAASFLFYPKNFRLANQPKRRHRIKWKIEVR